MNSRYTFPPPSQGWPELVRTNEAEPPRECNFKSIECPGLLPCSQCEHAPEHLNHLNQ